LLSLAARAREIYLREISSYFVGDRGAHVVMPQFRAADVTFLQLQNTVFCVSCELISYNNTTSCLACSSTALLSLSRLLGGAIREQDRARLIDDAVIDRVVENILEQHTASDFVSENSSLICAGAAMPPPLMCRTLPHALPRLQPAMRWVLDRACTATRADGAALALARQGKLVCHAHAGGSVPDLGVEIDLNRGISGLCARTAMSWRCDSSDRDPYVDRARCRELGTQSVLAAPVTHLNSVLGVLEVFSSEKNAFSNQDVATVQLLTGLLVVAITRGGRTGDETRSAGDSRWVGEGRMDVSEPSTVQAF
jgi:putative methionine-R-sulfoxide reductase with GAF domain